MIDRQGDPGMSVADTGTHASRHPSGCHTPARARFIGIDVGAETVKTVELLQQDSGFELGRRFVVEHGKEPQAAALNLLASLDWPTVTGAAATGRLSREAVQRETPS
jgi:activator of 2-hydroxyglutaryl-CoA dehydratase